jgi:hypothetical protein
VRRRHSSFPEPDPTPAWSAELRRFADALLIEAEGEIAAALICIQHGLDGALALHVGRAAVLVRTAEDAGRDLRRVRRGLAP